MREKTENAPFLMIFFNFVWFFQLKCLLLRRINNNLKDYCLSKQTLLNTIR